MTHLPRSLFLKIFLWFGAAMIAMVVVTFITNELARPEPIRQPLLEGPDSAVAGYAAGAAERFERGGAHELTNYLDELEHTTRMRGFLFGSELQELSGGRRIPTGAPEVVRRVLQTHNPEFATNGFPPLLARPVQTASGNEYVLVMELPRRQPPHLSEHLLHLLPLVLIGGAFCFWLARYLTAPLTKLRVATNELARGNLAARVGPAGNRRDELVSLGADFDKMAEQIESLVEAQRRLLGDISHELRSPLARLNVALELARQRSGGEAATALARIQREAENLNEMIGELLTLTRLETGAQEVRKVEMDLATLVREIAADADFEARSRNRSVELDGVASCTIIGNEHLLRRAIENVVRNAVQYTAEGTVVEIAVRTATSVQSPRSKVQSQKSKTATSGDPDGPNNSDNQAGVYAEIVVRDHGAGVPESALAEIFRPFYRVDDARDRIAGGVGLGLAIAERAIRLHDGTVTAANADGGGLVVTIRLPI